LSQFYLYDKDEFLTSMLRSQMQDKQQLFYEKGSLLENYTGCHTIWNCRL